VLFTRHLNQKEKQVSKFWKETRFEVSKGLRSPLGFQVCRISRSRVCHVGFLSGTTCRNCPPKPKGAVHTTLLNLQEKEVLGFYQETRFEVSNGLRSPLGPQACRVSRSRACHASASKERHSEIVHLRQRVLFTRSLNVEPTITPQYEEG
jgi:hypothetical protein